MVRLDRALLPTLALSYPSTFVAIQVRPHCQPTCPPVGAADVAVALGAAAGSLLVGVLVVGAVDRSAVSTHGRVRWALAPSRVTVAGLVLVYVAYLGFLLVDALGLYQGPLRLIPVLASLLLFAPAWALYVGTFVLAVLLPVLGIGPSPVLTTAARVVLVVIGLGGSAVWQFVLAEVVFGAREADGRAGN